MLYYAGGAILYIVLCLIVAMIGRRRKWGYWGYLWSSVLFTPLLGLVFVIAADPPPRRKRVTGKPPTKA